MSCEPYVFEFEHGETIDLTFTYENEDGTPIDLSSATVAVFSASSDVFKDNATVTATDAANGVVQFLLDRTSALDLKKGRMYQVRIQAIFGPDSDDVTPDINIRIR